MVSFIQALLLRCILHWLQTLTSKNCWRAGNKLPLFMVWRAVPVKFINWKYCGVEIIFSPVIAFRCDPNNALLRTRQVNQVIHQLHDTFPIHSTYISVKKVSVSAAFQFIPNISWQIMTDRFDTFSSHEVSRDWAYPITSHHELSRDWTSKR
jgi:hypothetical protein